MINMNKRYLVAAVAASAVAAGCLAAYHFTRPPALTVDFLPVGQGDSELISWGREQMLIDGGPDRTVLARLGADMPFFDRDIEYVVATHQHADHITGLFAVLEHYHVGKLILPAALKDAPEFAPLEAKAAAAGTEIVEAGQGDMIGFGPASFEVLWPPRTGWRPAGPPRSDEAVNDTSLVMRLAWPGAGTGGAVLFAADTGAAVEQRLIASGRPLAAAVLKVGHHGSAGSTTGAWLDAVRPKDAVIEVGRNNYGHPAYAALRRLEAAGVRVWRTDKDGDIRAVLDPGSGFRVFSRLFSGLLP